MFALHNFHTSSASFRVRIALNLKQLEYKYVPVVLKMNGGDQESPEYKKLNPQGIVPLLVDGDQKIMQSLAIIEYLEERHPEPRLLPQNAAARAHVRSLALFIACEMQPLNNLRTQRYLEQELHVDKDAAQRWRQHWVRVGFDALEQQLSGAGRFCHGDTPTIADCCLVPQVFNAVRPNVALDPAAWPTIHRVFQACMELPAFDRAQPKNQPDAA